MSNIDQHAATQDGLISAHGFNNRSSNMVWAIGKPKRKFRVNSMFVTNLMMLRLYNRYFKLIAAIVLTLSGSMVFSLSAAAAIQIKQDGDTQIGAPNSTYSSADGSLVGKVIDASGRPVAKATVRLTDSVTREVSTFESDENGKYHIRGLVAGRYTLQAQADGRQSDLTQVEVSNKAGTTQNLKIEPKK